jgi:hypothetical protein
LDITEAYQAFRVLSDDGTGRTAYSACDTVSVPDFDCRYDLLDADTNKGYVKVYDGDPSTTGVQVFDPDHAFSGDCYVQSGLLRLHVDEGVQYGLKLYGYIGAAWVQPLNRLYVRLVTDGVDLTYPFLKSIDSYGLEKCKVKVRLCDSATENTDYYADLYITIERGKYCLTFEFDAVSPLQNVRFSFFNGSALRFGYVGNAETYGVGDDDLNLNAANATMTDCFLVAFDDVGTAALAFIGANQTPSSAFQATDGGNLYVIDTVSTDVSTTKFFVGLVPFTNIAYTFKEAELATLVGGATAENDVTASGGQVAYLNAQSEYAYWRIVAGTHLPAGRYIVLFRVKDTNQVANDLRFYVYNSSDLCYRDEPNTYRYVTCAAAWGFFKLVFDITSADVSGTDNIDLLVEKFYANANAISVDYFLIVPLGNGSDFPQDQAHNALRTLTKTKNIYKR